MHRRILLVCLGLVPACSSSDEPETVYDPCSPLTIALAPDVGDAEVTGVEGAIAAWRHVLPTQITIGTGSQAVDVVPIQFETGVSFYRANYFDSVGMISISRDKLAPEDYPLAIAHELGHAFGLLHVPATERLSVMNVHNLEVSPTEEDAAGVRAQWASCNTTPAAE